MRIFLALATVLLLSTLAPAAHADPPLPLNLDAQGVAIQGYDPVAFFTEGKPVMGKPEFTGQFHGATYRFATAEHQAAFAKEPAKYEPQFGGFCAYGVTVGHLAPVQVEAFQIVDGRLLMQYNPEVRELFNKDRATNLKRADEKWPEVAAKGKTS